MRRLSIILVSMLLSLTTITAQEPIKNIIFLIGDGMGLASATMMQVENGYNETIFDRAENIALQKTYSADNRVTDSAASGTALATGYKTNNTYLGVTPDGTAVESLMEVAQSKGMATGVVVTTYLQHATPAAFYAHIPSRHEYLAITEQLLASSLDVARGGGKAFFVELYGEKLDKRVKQHGYTLAESLNDISKIDANQRVMALVADKELEERKGYLAAATREALRLLEDNDNGFVLMVEGSLIDGMGHANDAKGQQQEMRDFMEAIEVAVAYAKAHPETLVVVTADHGTGGLTIISGNADFTLSEQGVEYNWATHGHSGEMVPIYLYGTGAERINGIMENADLGKRLIELVQQR